MEDILKTWLISGSFIFFVSSCSTSVTRADSISVTDTSGIIKASLDSSFVYASKFTQPHVSTDTSAFTSHGKLDTIMHAYFSKDFIHKVKYLDQDSLCKLAHFYNDKGLRISNVTNLVSFGRDSLGDYHVVLERARMITETRVTNRDTIRDCGFGAGSEWMIFLHFKKKGDRFQPKVDHWEIH
jgi:hypothetical protein